MFVETNIKFPTAYIELPVNLTINEVDQAHAYFVGIINSEFSTPDTVRSYHFKGAYWLRFLNKCLYKEFNTDENWNIFFNDYLKKEYTAEHKKFYTEAANFFKPYIFKMCHSLEHYTSKKHYVHGIEINMMPAHSDIKPHIDEHILDIQTHRVHLVLSTNDQAYMICNGEKRHFNKGQCFIFNNKMLHSVHNEGDTPRTHLVVDFLQIV